MTQADSFTTLQKRKYVCAPSAFLEPAIVVWVLDEFLSPALPQSLPTGNADQQEAPVMTGVQRRHVTVA